MEVSSTRRHACDKIYQAPPLSRAMVKWSRSLGTKLDFDYFLSQCVGNLQTVIDYSRFDSNPGPHTFTLVAVSTTEQQVEFDYPFNVSGKCKNIIKIINPWRMREGYCSCSVCESVCLLPR